MFVEVVKNKNVLPHCSYEFKQYNYDLTMFNNISNKPKFYNFPNLQNKIYLSRINFISHIYKNIKFFLFLNKSGPTQS